MLNFCNSKVSEGGGPDGPRGVCDAWGVSHATAHREHEHLGQPLAAVRADGDPGHRPQHLAALHPPGRPRRRLSRRRHSEGRPREAREGTLLLLLIFPIMVIHCKWLLLWFCLTRVRFPANTFFNNYLNFKCKTLFSTYFAKIRRILEFL